MGTVTLQFRGLCGFGMIDEEYLAIMPTTHRHRAVLMAPANQIDIDGSDEPDFIVDTFENSSSGASVQHAGWNLGGKKVRFEGSSGVPKWEEGHRAQTIDLRRLHGPHEIKRDGCAFVLPRGILTVGDRKERYDVWYPDRIVAEEAIAMAVNWTGDGVSVIQDAAVLSRLQIALKSDKDKDVTITISNAAPVTGGHASSHFQLYYGLVKDFEGTKAKIEFKGDPMGDRLSGEVYDCVPPAPLPDPEP